MARYAVEPDKWGRLFDGVEFPPHYPCDFLDANGKLIDENIVFVDTEVGLVVSHYLDDTGGKAVSHDEGLNRVRTSHHPAPLVCVLLTCAPDAIVTRGGP